MSILEKEQLLADIDNALNEVRPHLAVDGGNIEVVDVKEDMTVQVKWLGNCDGCSMSTMTMRAGVERTIKDRIPGIKGVEAINGISL